MSAVLPGVVNMEAVIPICVIVFAFGTYRFFDYYLPKIQGKNLLINELSRRSTDKRLTDKSFISEILSLIHHDAACVSVRKNINFSMALAYCIKDTVEEIFYEIENKEKRKPLMEQDSLYLLLKKYEII